MNQKNQNQINQNQGMLSNPYINNTQNMNNPQGIQSNPYINQGMANNANPNNGLNGNDFIKGALIGAGISFLLTNKTTQSAIFNGFSKASELFNVGMEELKERIEDAKASMQDTGVN
ncbi:MAG: YtxH domain-containing protein [Arcobacter sp.]|nr:YtxH domain-containing protein [Arcobacter sp.]